MNFIVLYFLTINLIFGQTPPATPPALPQGSPPTAPSEAIPEAPPAIPANGEMPKSDEAVNQAEANMAAMPTEFVWDQTGKKDPFRPFKAPRVLRSDSETQIDPLLLLELSKVNVVAVLWNTVKPRAIIQAESGPRYTIFKNTKIGPNSGYVADIREGEVVVIETFDDGFGNVIKEPKIITMKKNYPIMNQDKLGNLKDTGGQNAD